MHCFDIPHKILLQHLYISLYLEVPDTFVPITFTLNGREFTDSLNDPTSDDYQTLSTDVKNNVGSI